MICHQIKPSTDVGPFVIVPLVPACCVPSSVALVEGEERTFRLDVVCTVSPINNSESGVGVGVGVGVGTGVGVGSGVGVGAGAGAGDETKFPPSQLSVRAEVTAL